MVHPPGAVFIELTSHCNMHCDFCPSDILRRPRRHLADADLRSFLAQLHAMGLRPPILCNILGEPLLNPLLFEYLDLFELEGHAVTLISNMTMLQDKAVQRKILRHANLTLAMSLQTVTRRSFAARGYRRLPLRRFFAIAHEVISEKFRLGSSTRLEIHVASCHRLAADPAIQSDVALDLWSSFKNPRAERRFIVRFMDRLERQAKRTARRHAPAFQREEERTRRLYREHIGTRIAVTREMIPGDFLTRKEDSFWGYMFMPNVFLVFKSFEPWTKDRDFLRRMLPPKTRFYVEERIEPQACSMTGNLGLLADGGLIFCCLDYEGEMRLGNIRQTKLADLLSSGRRQKILADAAIEALCRRCRAKLFVFATQPLAAAEQEIDKFGRGWEPHEEKLYGRGGRWTRDLAYAYVFTRIAASRIRLAYYSEQDEATAIHLRIAVYDEAHDVFLQEKELPFASRSRRHEEFSAAHVFAPGALYRIEIASPTFVPDDRFANGDRRSLGIAVSSLNLLS